MQKNAEHSYRSDSGTPLIVCIVLGVLFFGSYIAVEHLAGSSMPPIATALAFLGVYLVLALLTYLFFRLKARKQRDEQILLEALNTKMHNMFKYVVDLPYAIVDEQGRARALNRSLQDLIGAPDPFFRGTVSDICNGTTLQEILDATTKREDTRTEVGKLTSEAMSAAAEEEADRPPEALAADGDGCIVQLRDGNRYVARAYPLNLNGRINQLVTFTDVTELCNLKEKTERDMPAVAYIDIDNLEELTQYTRVNYRDASRQVDDILLQWAASMDGFLREYERDRYFLLFSQEKLRQCEEDKFSALLDRVRGIRLGEYSIPVTVSVGVSLADCSMAERAKDAASALDMALQRGGDQVAVRRKDGIRYYGGQTRPFQRRPKVQSRVVANYLLSKISESDNLLIMGHRNPDFDSIGSCIGVAQLGLLAGVPTKIIADLSNANFRIATERLVASPVYRDMFISGHKGLDLIRPRTLLILSDVNNFEIIEAPDVAASVRQVSGRIAIIDHHRQTGEYDFEPIINHIDPGASSASELVTEMLEQIESGNDSETNKMLSDEVASVILSGIMLDTGGFTRNTGSRTLDAARYLYGKGANAEYVHTFFNEDYADYVCERSFSGCTLLHGNTVGLTWSHGTGRGADDRVAAAKEADRLLNVKGVHASFALVVIDNLVHISGRSDGTVNVQLILERLGGGGRFDSAGAALKGIALEAAVDALRNAVNAFFTELENKHHAE
ncbi:MAG: DHH family phosphoesterase [Clostridia bacterium]|nr:DHH family phosphoesterase [Clostridia bacterium]